MIVYQHIFFSPTAKPCQIYFIISTDCSYINE